ncbi:hypothetical protein FB567DRAFT_598489 [Paraphoma chrysanthemicola]|uniref:ASST-domain-containing protein n=1 Tax=Paraphoma chrysanthemicola TaxID=798071 RepID=A0A8K0VSZ7_9PLEO|nr:hypothetical protein FB567DRAFT_598489 [Paraphoma chrysanthemicola]
MINLRSLLVPLVLVARVVLADACENVPEPIIYPRKGPIVDSQDLNSTSFIGSPANATCLGLLYKFYPDASLMHGNGGNSGARDEAGPLGHNPNVTSEANTINMMVWGADGSLTGGYANTSNGGTPALGLVALEPDTLQVLASWYPPDNETLRLSYLEYIQVTNDIVLSTKQGHIYVVHRDTCNGTPYFTTIRTIALADEMQPGEQLLNAMYDTAGNIWFTTGGTINGGDAPQTSSTYGYITTQNKVIKNHISDEMMENGIAVSGTNIFMVTGPTNASTSSNSSTATGYMYSLTSTTNHTSIKINWRVPYTGESQPFPRGSGTSPALLTNKYVAITDRSGSQVNLNIYHQSPQPDPAAQQLACQIPLFALGASNADNAVLAHFDGEHYSFIVQNNYGIPDVYSPKSSQPVDVNGKWNDMSSMPGGMARIDIHPDNNTCEIVWTNELAIKSVSVLSTGSGLVYVYTQDRERAKTGEYVWYVAGVEWASGEVVWKVKTGMGGVFNDNYLQGTVGNGGGFYQGVLGG